MTNTMKKTFALSHLTRASRLGVAVLLSASLLSGCSGLSQDTSGHLGGWANISPTQRHPIVVGEQPANLTLRVARGADGLNTHQRANFAEFLSRYRGSDTGNGKLVIVVPSGTGNEIASLKAVADMRAIVRDFGIDDTRVNVQPHRVAGERDPAIHISYTRYVAEAPDCGAWPDNLGADDRNLPYANFGCANQRNLAMMAANPADLLGPRTMTPMTGERRDERWAKWNKGETTTSAKSADEKASTQGNN
ncbi:MAG: CpaD family pilus assembly protein [Proteobacteria bacterium]|nr:CpaD family pilus assembly protein [Pseudomonadota bacterium]